VQTTLDRIFELDRVRYAPTTAEARRAAREWDGRGLPIYLGDEVRFEAYTRGTGYGRVRVWDLAAFEAASRVGRITSQDILVLERAPTDIEGIFAGVITAERQGPLSHVAIRAARRGTPNAFLASALDDFAALDGELVRLDILATGFEVRPATFEEAEAWWAENRPRLAELPSVDRDYARLDALAEIDLGAEARPEARFGGKATNLARLARLLDGEFERYREVGFAIPMHHYFEFLRTNHFEIDGERRSYEEHLARLVESAEFQSDPEVRFRLLDEFRRNALADGQVSIFLVLDVLRRTREVFGSDRTMLRLRSSSNVEDLLEFNGAGLYESTSACGADSLDGDDEGPSACAPEDPDERVVAGGLKRVWTSLWTFRAHEERAWYGLPSDDIAMGILATRAFLDERAGGVAFTGNPANPRDRRYIVTAQFGEESVVRPEPGVLPEKDVLVVDRDRGVVLAIERAQRSTLAVAGEFVLGDETLRELGAVLAKIDREFPVELGTHDRDEVLFDIEFKVEAAGSLAIKQVRPFLAAAPPPAGPVIELEIRPGAVLCGQFLEGRSADAELAAKSVLCLRAGTYELPTDIATFPGDIVDEVVYGGEDQRALATGAGRFHVETTSRGDGTARHRFRFEQDFILPSGESFALEIEGIDVESSGGAPPSSPYVLDDRTVGAGVFADGVPGGDLRRKASYGSCTLDALPLWNVRARLADDTTIDLAERFRPALAGTGPAGLVAADVTLAGTRQETADYWRLVYTSLHHNFHVAHRVLLEPPITLAGVGSVRAIDIEEPQPDAGRPARAAYLDTMFRVLATPPVASYWRGAAGDTPPGFRRGDTNGDDRVNISDAIFLLGALFQGTEPLTCEDAGDFDDDGLFEINDAVLILTFLFQGVDLSEPPGPYECGLDPTRDFLADCAQRCE